MRRASLYTAALAALMFFAAIPGGLAETTIDYEIAKLLASDGAEGASFGYAVDVDGDTAVIGAPQNSELGRYSGAAYVFRLDSGGSWIEQTKLLADDGARGDNFGCSVAISGDLILVGARLDNATRADSGSAYVYARDESGNWTQTAKLLANDARTGDQFGESVDLHEDTAVVGAYYHGEAGSLAGSAYVFRRNSAGTWVQQAELIAWDGAAYDRFGTSVAVHADTVAIGANHDDDTGNDSGSVYIFTRETDGAWHGQAKLLAGDGAADDSFGSAVAIYGNTAIIGAPFSRLGAGSLYVFNRYSGGAWSQQAKIYASDGEPQEYLGWSVEVDHGILVAAAHHDSSNAYHNGAVYVFQRDGDDWSHTHKLLASDRSAGDVMGAAAVSGGTVIAGAWGDDDQGISSGSAYVFDLGLTTEVDIDIRPFSSRNPIVPWSRGLIPVAILGSGEFDAMRVDPSSLEFGRAGAAPFRSLLWTMDTNRDGFTDLVVPFRMRATGILCGDEDATLTGHTYTLAPFAGTDSVTTVGCKRSSKSRN